MKSFFLLSCLFAAAAAKPGFFSYAPVVATQQYHAQDGLGQYTYGYSGGPSAKEETKTADGVTRGSYSYIDAHGIVQSASYVSDPINGFRVAATNLPTGPSAPAAAIVAAPAVVSTPSVVAAPAVVSAPAVVGAPFETPEVIAAKAAHFAAHHEALARLGRKKRSVHSVLTSYHQTPIAYSAPAAAVVSGPAVVAAKTATVVAAAPAIVETPSSVAYSTPESSVVSSSAPVTGSFSYSSSSVAAAPVTTVHAAPEVVAARTVVAAAPAIVETPSSVAYSTPDSSVVSSNAPVSGSFSYSSSSVAASPVPAETAAVVAAAPVVAHSYSTPVAVAAPVVAHSYSTPVVAAAPVVAAVSSQYSAQDDIGQYSYGYSDHLSSKHESRTADGTTFGKYSYLDSNGIVQSVNYVADHAGFRAQATNLPVA